MTQTNAYTVFVVMLRAAALWLFCKAALSLPGLIGPAREFGWGLLLLALAIPMVIAVLTWLFGHKLARVVMARPDQPTFESDIPAAEWQSLAFSVVGLWQAVTALIDIVFHGFHWLAIRRAVAESMGVMSWPDDFWANWAASVLQLAIGVALMLGSRGLVAVIRKWRYSGASFDGPSAGA